MSSHDARGDTLCIHSVCTAPAFRRLGVAHTMLRRYVAALERAKFDTEVAMSTTARDELAHEQAEATTADVQDKAHAALPLFNLERVLLLSKAHNTPLYTRAGWAVDGPSAVCHGADQWMQCSLGL
jgi:hypothetical protein